jgi:acyl-CoA synthetase (AMP-forming)/AMP-acid ligase II
VITNDPWSLRAMPSGLRERYLREGWWDERTLGHMLLGWLEARRELPFCIWSTTRPQHSTYGEVATLARRLATGLARRGIQAGDAVCIYVPNSVEGALGFYAVPTIGAVLVPVAPFYGMKELRFILARSGARILITADAPAGGRSDGSAGGRLEGIAALRAELPALEDVYVIGETMPAGMRPYKELLAPEPLAELPAVDPDGVAAVAFTSGTTSDPKGVVHTHRSLCSEVRLHMDTAPRQKRPLLVGGPISHITGMLIGIMLQPYRGVPVHIIEGWDVPLVLRAMREAGLTAGAGATVFLNSIFNHPDTTREDLANLEDVPMGGSTIPIPFAEHCESLGIKIMRFYGSTEHPSVTGVPADAPLAKRQRTDGRALPGVEMRVLDEDGNALPPDTPGELVTRGPDLFAGYIDPAMNAELIDAEGWFHTGDIGVIDPEGYFTVTDRKKDIIIRNGVKVSALEVENCLLQMPSLMEVAVVAAPDARTGERGHAILRVKPGAGAPTLEEIRAHLGRVDLARQKWPESIEVIEDFPRTASGKVKKFELRDAVRKRAG